MVRAVIDNWRRDEAHRADASALAALGCFLLSSLPAAAMVGGAPPAGEAGRAVVLIVGSHGTSCTGVALRAI